jgi:hypothetical protein
VPGNTLRVGSIAFAGACGRYDRRTVTWRPDGGELDADGSTPRRFSATGQSIGMGRFDAPLLADKPAW